MESKLKRQLISAFKLHGFTLRGEATKYLLEVLSTVEQSHHEASIDRLIESIRKLPLENTTIERKHCEQSVAECNEEQNDNAELMHIIDAFSIPNYIYNGETKKFHLSKAERSISAGASAKVTLFHERYTILYQRTIRHELFTPSVMTNLGSKDDKFQLKTIDFLLGSTKKLGDIIVLGMLTQMKEGKWYLEDPTGAVCLDLRRTNFHLGLFTENCFVLAEGSYDDGLFQVCALGFPPPEPSTTTRLLYSNINFFGGPSEVLLKDGKKLKQIEMENDDAMFVFISDLWLDDVKVMLKLRTLFDGYSQTPPACFVFCGNFLSQPYGHNEAKLLKDCLKGLADLICEFPSLMESSKFVFIPGPQDPGPSPILPRPGIPVSIHEAFSKKVPNATFATNPCRILYCTQEIIVFRENIISKMCRNCLRHPTDGNIPDHFVKTIICQGHLCPLPLHVEPIYWSFDNSLRTYPLPDLIVCCDKFDPYTVTQNECNVVNPGTFSRSGFSFKVYWPSTKQVEDCKIDS